MSVIWNLYLDDIRDPEEAGWNIARNVEHAKIMIGMWGLPQKMSLDHDLEDGLDAHEFVKWLVFDKQYDLRRTQINVHSANPFAKNKMLGLIENWNNELDERDMSLAMYNDGGDYYES